MNCFTRFSIDSDKRNQCGIDCLTFGWTYYTGWATVAVAMIGTIISTVSFFIKSEGTGNYSHM